MPGVSQQGSNGTASAQRRRSVGEFIVREISADMLRKHPLLSKGARMLWLAMKAMADHRTGELRHRHHWFSGKEIDLRAEISPRQRKDLMKELVKAGLVQWERERVMRYLRDRATGHQRRRWVLGRTHYSIPKVPPTRAGRSTVQSVHGARIAPTILSEIHQEGMSDASSLVFGFRQSVINTPEKKEAKQTAKAV
jgi:hypothetical protein